MRQLDQRRRCAPSFLGRALEDAALVLKTQCADATRVIDRQEEIERIQRMALNLDAGAPGFLPPLGVVAQNDTARPAVGLGTAIAP